MANLSNTYHVTQTHSATELQFVFFSRGRNVVTKLILYTRTHQFEGFDVYNLGFGDYNEEIDDIEDQVRTNNGDAYKVFHTVLSTVPLFFEAFPKAILMIQGSDSGPDFSRECRKICQKNCQTACQKLNQRVSIYRNFVEKHFAELSDQYWFLGGYLKSDNRMATEHYIIGKEYDAILMFRK